MLIGVCLSLCANFAVPTCATRQPGRDGQSLEELLTRARRERDAIQARLKSEVEALQKEFESAPDARDLPAKVERAVALGAEATPLLAALIDPGEAPSDAQRLRASQFAIALARMDTTAVTTQLLALLRSGSSEGKRNVLRALQTTTDRARVGPEVERVFRTSEGPLKTHALRALIALGGEGLTAILTEILGGTDDTMIGLAIDGLADQKCASAVEQVRRILAQSQVAARHALALLRYFRTVPEVRQAQDITQFVRLAQSATIPLDIRVGIVESLLSLEPALNGELRKNMEPIVGSADRRLREAGLVLLANLGDKNARRDLIKEYDELVEKNERWFDAYVRRADMYAKIGDDDEAIKDYKQALAVGRDESLPTELYEKLSLAYTRKGKFKDAAELLNRAPISAARLKELSEDARYAPLRNSKYGKDAFGLK